MKKRTLIFITAMVIVLAMVTGATLSYFNSSASKVENTFVSGGFGVISLREIEDDGSNPTNGWLSGANHTHTNIYTVVPGADIKKDPQVKFEFDSNAVVSGAYVFIKITYDTSDPDNRWHYAAVDGGVNATLNATVNGVANALSITLGNNWKIVGGGTSDATGTIVLTSCADGGAIRSITKAENPLKDAFSIFKADANGKTIDVSTALTAADTAEFQANNTKFSLSFSAYAIQKNGYENNVIGAWNEVNS